jgi:hypothetical protein
MAAKATITTSHGRVDTYDSKQAYLHQYSSHKTAFNDKHHTCKTSRNCITIPRKECGHTSQKKYGGLGYMKFFDGRSCISKKMRRHILDNGLNNNCNETQLQEEWLEAEYATWLGIRGLHKKKSRIMTSCFRDAELGCYCVDGVCAGQYWKTPADAPDGIAP